MKTCETTKLFYGEYGYKLEVFLRIASIFRNKNFEHCAKVLQRLKNENGADYTIRMPYWAYGYVSGADLKDAEYLLERFTEQDSKQFKLRVEQGRLSVYSNNPEWLQELSSKVSVPLYYWEPKVTLEKNTVFLREQIPFEYRVTCKGNGSSAFAKYASENTDKIKIGDCALECHQNGWQIDNLYFYVKNDKVLTLVQLMLSNLIRRVDKVKYR